MARSNAELIASINKSMDFIKKTLDPAGEITDEVFDQVTKEVMLDQMMAL